MQLRALYREDDAVSSVLGVVLMVAVTIVLAAVVGTFVLGIGSDLTDSSPSVDWEFSVNVDENSTDDNVLILHGGGDNVDRSALEVTIGGDTVYQRGTVQGSNLTSLSDNFPEEVTTGDRLLIEEDSGERFQPGDMIRVIWHSGDKSTILAEQRL